MSRANFCSLIPEESIVIQDLSPGPKDRIDKVEDCFKTMLASRESWIRSRESEGTTVYTYHPSQRDRVILLSETLLDIPSEDLAYFLDDPEKRPTYDNYCTSQRVVECIDDGVKILYSIHKFGWFTTNRDEYWMRARRNQEDGSILFLGTGIPEAAHHTGHIRGDTQLFCLKITPREEGEGEKFCRLTVAINTSIEGALPSALVQMVLSYRQPRIIKDLLNLAKEHAASQPQR